MATKKAAKSKKVPAADVGYGEEKWRAESDMRTLLDAEAIRNDPARHKKAMACARTKLGEMQKIVKQG